MLVFTDLDGSLLNSHDYSFEDAAPALQLLRRNSIPLIFCTSKTRKEVETLRYRMVIDDPFIVENGGGIFFNKKKTSFEIPEAANTGDYLLIQLGQRYETIRDFIKKNKQQFSVEGFGDWTVEVIQQLTGLTHEEAVFAKLREFTEPFILKKIQELAEFEAAATKAGLKIVKGGRFFHLIGEKQDKGKAVEIIKKIYQETRKTPVFSIGLGDSANDIPMLNSVDIPILIPHPDGTLESFEHPKLVKADYSGSKGWDQALRKVLDGLS
jgi:mannosyl-3-phosphoglycerate phosphatase